MLEHMKVGQFTLRIRALDDLHLPAYKGSTFRGGFGQALRRVACPLKLQECKTCLLQSQCVYLYLFETPPAADAEMMRLYPAAPHPFVIEPPLIDDCLIQGGKELDFNLILIGRALDYLPYFIYAFISLGEQGLGRGRGRFALDEVLVLGRDDIVSIYDGHNQVLRQYSSYLSWETVYERSTALCQTERISFRFMTPMRIKYEDHLVEKPEFHHLVRSLLRRLSSLSYFHGGRKLDLDFRGIIERAREIKPVCSDIKWHDWERYSSRQKQHMVLGGFVGHMTFDNSIKEFLSLFAWGELVHLGKAASFGLGKFVMLPQC
jgi:hypothetical protein